MIRGFVISLLLGFGIQRATADITSVGQMADILNRHQAVTNGTPFEFTAHVDCLIALPNKTVILAISDAADHTVIYADSGSDYAPTHPGDVIRVTGRFSQQIWPLVRSLRILRHEDPPAPEDAALKDIVNGQRNGQVTRVRGIVRDVLKSRTSREWVILSLCDSGETLRVHLPARKDSERLFALIGREISVVGFPNFLASPHRLFTGCDFHCPGISCITPLARPVSSADEPPDISTLFHQSMSRISTSGRVKTQGKVLCSWDGHFAMIQTQRAGIVHFRTEAADIPRKGTCVEVIGFPQSDFFHITLTHASWKPIADIPLPEHEVCPTTPNEILTGPVDRNTAEIKLHGRDIRIRGRVRATAGSSASRSVIPLEDNGIVFSADVSNLQDATPAFEPGSIIEAVGTCVFDIEYWRPGIVFPQIKGFSVVISDPGDIRLLSRPSWWTPARLFAIIGTLLVCLFAILVWNTALRRLAARKGRELFREQLGHVKAELRTEERTHLAVELHDTLAQNLTGVSLEIDTAAKLADDRPEDMKTHLSIAARSLKSCRDELRNCLWDLRSRALETGTMDEAIRQTLAPHVAGVAVAIRFNVPRERISDNTAHAILRIIRELTLNGIRHGGATKVWIAGSIENGRMHFSVRDNGCGFDPGSAPGFGDGHYGLLGIQERIDEFEGEFMLKSSPGKGTRATVSINVPQET